MFSMKVVNVSRKGTSTDLFFLWFSLFFLILLPSEAAVKLRYASVKECDRFSLDAVYHDKFKLITNNILADCKEFVSRVSDLVADSLTTIMSELPHRDVSDNQERKIHTQFKNLKSVFASRIKKIHRNITSSWESLIVSHFDLMYDNENCSLYEYLNKTLKVIDNYANARTSLDSNMATFVSFIKATVRDGLGGIVAAAKDRIKREKTKKNDTQGDTSQQKKAESKEDEENILQKKKEEIAEMIATGFLGNITVEVIKRKIDLNKAINTKPEERDSVLDDIQFDMIMIKNRIKSIIQPDLPKDKGSIDLARRSIYTYWVSLAEEMYKEKMKAEQSTSGKGRIYYRNLWNDEEKLAETLLDLMEIYP